MLTYLPNVLAMVISLFAMILLLLVSRKLGGELGTMFKLIVVGIFFSVFVHAGAELVAVAGYLSEETLMPIMGVLLTTGCLTLCLAGGIGLKALD